jgi:antitoxin component of MazEF toxin-antitoxin module
MDQEGAPTTIDLEEGSEWRFELENDENIAVRVSAHFTVFECLRKGQSIGGMSSQHKIG